MTEHDETMVERMRLANPAPHAMAGELAELSSEIDERIGGAVGGADSYVGEPRRSVGRTVWYRRPVFVAAAAALVAFAIMLPVAFLGGSDSGVAIDSVASTTTPLAATTAAPGIPDTTHASTTTVEGVGLVAAPLPAGLAMTWQRVADGSVFERAWMRSVAVGGPGLVAVGSTELLAAAVWVSEDGATWRRVESPSFEAPPEIQDRDGQHERFMTDVAAGPNGIVAIGGDRSDLNDDGVTETVVWHSTDGLVWETVESDVIGLAQINAVSPRGSGFVAVGVTYTDGLPGRPAVWLSPDGREWSEVADESLAAGPGYVDGELFDVTEGGPGLVAVGCEFTEESGDGFESWINRHPGIWVSTDGNDWERLPDDSVIDPNIELHGYRDGIPTCIATVAASESGFVGVGDWGDRAWLSTDGYTWTITQSATPSIEINNYDGYLLSAATIDGDRVVGAGTGPSVEHTQRSSSPPAYLSAAFWALESDADAWFLVDHSEAITRVGMVQTDNMNYSVYGVVDDVIPFQGGFVAVGHDATYNTEPDDELVDNWCGYESEWTGSCRTDAAVWIGQWEQ
jgi:hypothetical protein